MATSKKTLLPIFFVIFMDNFGFGVIFNMLPIVFIDPHFHLISLHASAMLRNILLAITFGVFPLTQLIGAPLIGDFADHFGRKKALNVTILTVTLGYVLSAMAVSINSLVLLIVSRLFTGFFAGNLSICLAAIADFSLDEKSRGRNFSHVTTLFGFSWIIAMVVSGYVSNPKYLGTHGPTVVFLLTALCSFLSYFAVRFWFNESFATQQVVKFDLMKGFKNLREAFFKKRIRSVFLTYFFWVVGWAMAMQWYAAYSMEVYLVSAISTTTWMTVMGITWTLGSSVLNNLLLNRWHSVSIAVFGSIVTTICLYLEVFISWFELFSFVLALAAIFSAFTMCNTLNLTSLAASSDIQGKVMGLSQSIMSFGWIFSSILGLILVQLNMYYLYWAAAIFLSIATLLLFWMYFSHKVHHVSEEPVKESDFIDHQKQ